MKMPVSKAWPITVETDRPGPQPAPFGKIFSSWRERRNSQTPRPDIRGKMRRAAWEYNRESKQRRSAHPSGDRRQKLGEPGKDHKKEVTQKTQPDYFPGFLITIHLRQDISENITEREMMTAAESSTEPRDHTFTAIC